MLIRLICILCVLLIILSTAAIIITLQPEPSNPSTGDSSQSTSSSSSSSQFGESSSSTIPGSSSTVTVPSSSTEPTESTTQPTDPTTQPTQPTTQPTQPTTQPTDPTTQPTQPTTQPTQPTTQPTQPTTQPTQPTTQPTQPTTQPTQPTTQPTQPTTQPTTPSVPFDEEKFFSESVFIGDSVTLGLSNYCIKNKDALHGAKILCAGSYAVRFAIADPSKAEISITYQGQKTRPEDALAAIGAKRVFIMLGLNDIGLAGIDKTITNWGTLIKNIRAKCPNIEIYIQSGTPLYKGKGSLNNENMDKYNVKLQQFCKDNGCYFVNVAETMKDSQGILKKEYCSDEYCHLSTAGVKAWITYLKAYAAANHK